MSVFTKPVLIALSFTESPSGAEPNNLLCPISSAGLYNKGVPWNGITAITESPSGAEPNNLYADNIKYLVLVGAEDFGLTVECYTYHPVCQWQSRPVFKIDYCINGFKNIKQRGIMAW